MPPAIPDDVVKEIIADLSDDYRALKACACTHSTWLPHARTHLFSCYTASLETKTHQPAKLACVLPYVHTLVICNRPASRASGSALDARTLSQRELNRLLNTFEPWLTPRLRTLELRGIVLMGWAPLDAAHVLDRVQELDFDSGLFTSEAFQECIVSLPSLRRVTGTAVHPITPLPSDLSHLNNLDTLIWDSLRSGERRAVGGLAELLQGLAIAGSPSQLRNLEVTCTQTDMKALADLLMRLVTLKELIIHYEMPQMFVSIPSRA
jgi:hypothetical protein